MFCLFVLPGSLENSKKSLKPLSEEGKGHFCKNGYLGSYQCRGLLLSVSDGESPVNQG